MNKFFNLLNTSVGRKWLMALTGLFLSLFLVIHMLGNLQLFRNDGGMAFNQYSIFMTTFMPIKIVSYLLYATILLHALNGFYLMNRNRMARPVSYASRKDTRSSSWASRNMGILGIVLLAFIITHMANFWYVYKFGDIQWKSYVVESATGKLMKEEVIPTETVSTQNFKAGTFEYMGSQVLICKDLYGVVKKAFTNPALVAFYVIAMIALSYHMLHGFQSSFQTLGIRHPRYAGLIKGAGTLVFALIIPALFAAMPIYFLFYL